MRTKDRSIGYAWRLDSRFLLRLVRLLACAALIRVWVEQTEEVTTTKYTHARVFVWSAWRAAKNVKGERERENIPIAVVVYPSLATTDSRLLLVEVEPAVSWPSVAPLISVTVFGTTWGYFYSRLPAFPSLPFSFSRVGRYYLPTYPPKVVLSCNRSNGSDLVCRINFSKSHKRRRNKNTFSFKKRKIK